MDISKFSSKTVCIVKFTQPKELREAIEAGMTIPPREIHYQVTVDPEALSASERFIRFGNLPGDELTGWMPLDTIELVEVLATNGRLNTETNQWDFDKVQRTTAQGLQAA